LWPGLPDGPARSSKAASNEALGGVDWPSPLVLLCALLADKPAIAGATAASLSHAEWQIFCDLVIARHRVAPSIAEALSVSGVVPPGDILEAIQAEARANGFAALAQKNESLHLAGVLETAGIGAIWLKGWPLAEQLYGATGMRQSNDIDLLVDPDDRVAAARCLRDAGYVPDQEHSLRARLIGHPAVRAECKDVQFLHAETGMAVELHWRTSHFRAWPELRDLSEQPVSLPGVTGGRPILVPGALGQLVFLAEHGQQHLYSRLKWLLDIARLARLRGPARLGEDMRRAEAAGAGRSVRLAVHLACRVFAAAKPIGFRELPRNEARWVEEVLADIADPQMAPGQPWARVGFYCWHLRMAATPMQFVGVLRSAVWRRLRLRLAGSMHPAPGTDA